MGPPAGPNLASSERKAASDKEKLLKAQQKQQPGNRKDQRVVASENLRQTLGLQSRAQEREQLERADPPFKQGPDDDGGIHDPGTPDEDLDDDAYDEQEDAHLRALSAKDTAENNEVKDFNDRRPGHSSAEDFTSTKAQRIYRRLSAQALDARKELEIAREDRNNSFLGRDREPDGA